MTDACPDANADNLPDADSDAPPRESVIVRPGSARGRTQLGWLDSRHTFSFGDYRDIDQMGFHCLRVINDDRVAPGGGFGEHPHRDMEILTWVLDGALRHADSLGHESILHPGELQVMTAGRGIRHSEFNASLTDPVHFLQIWIRPREHNLEPRYAQQGFKADDLHNRFRLVASPSGENGPLTVEQDAWVYIGRFDAHHPERIRIAPGRVGWFQVARGEIVLGDQALVAGDGAAVTASGTLDVVARSGAEVLYFNLPAESAAGQ